MSNTKQDNISTYFVTHSYTLKCENDYMRINNIQYILYMWLRYSGLA